MKTKTFIISLIALVCLSTTSTASTPSNSNLTPDGIRTEIINQLSNSDMSLEILSKTELRICFTINASGEMNIEKIESNTNKIESYFFDKLQGMKVSKAHEDTEQLYWITLKYRVV